MLRDAPMNVLCLLTGHHRSKRRLRRDLTFGWRSQCKFCGKPMVRLAPRHWCIRSKNLEETRQSLRPRPTVP